MLAPGSPNRHVQFVDVGDLGAWLVHIAEERITGTFNATGPEPPVTMGEVLETCRRVGGTDARLVWADEDFLLEQGAGPWMELPLWLPGSEASLLQADVSAAVLGGLRFRPLEDTVRDTLEWSRAGSPGGKLASGLDIGEAGLRPEREAELLAAWREASGA